MVKITDESSNAVHPELENPILLQKKKKVRLTAFTSSASLILSWAFPTIVLCFQANQRLILDPRIYTALIMAFLLSGSLRRLLLERYLSVSFFNAIIPAVLGLLGNGVFVTALYKGEGFSVIAVLFMIGSRLLFGWSTYSAEDYNRRAKNAAKSSEEKMRLRQRVIDMVPDLQDSTFHAGVIVALVICFILEVCLRSAGPQMSEFYSVLILTGFSTLISTISIPSLHKAVKSLVNIPINEGNSNILEPNSSAGASTTNVHQPSGDAAVVTGPFALALTFRNKYLVSTLFTSLKRFQYPPGQLIMILFSALLTTATILFDYLLLPYLVVYLRRCLFTKDDIYFPFPDFILIYATLFASELLFRTFILEYTDFGNRAIRWVNSTLIGALLGVSCVSFLMPSILYALASATSHVAFNVFGLGLFVVCVMQGLLKAAHDLFGGILFAKYCDLEIRIPKSVAETGEQLLGVVRCFFAALFFIIGGGVLYHQRFMATLTMIIVVYAMALSAAIVGFIRVLFHEKALAVRIELPD
ncbi:hypothetical protein Aperf_G00000011142 [Anoplocephala perfoliata]